MPWVTAALMNPLSNLKMKTLPTELLRLLIRHNGTKLFDLSDVIVNRGLVVDYTGHVGKMLERTSGATGGKSPYLGARYLQFCSAKLSQAAMQADPDNLAICPYVVFAYELKSEPGTARVGYRRPIAGQSRASREAIAAVEKLLDDIIGEAEQ